MDAESFEQFAEALPEPMLLMAGDGSVLAANRAARREWGEDLAGGTLFELVRDPPEKVSRYLRLWSRNREPIPASLRWRRTSPEFDGGRSEGVLVRPRLAGGAALILLRCCSKLITTARFVALNEKIEALGREVTGRKRAEAALRSQRGWSRATLASIGDGVVVTDREGRLTFLNPMAERLLGWKVEEAYGQPLEQLLQLLDEQTRRPLENPVIRVLREGLCETNHSVLVARDGSEWPIDNRGAPIRGEQGEVIGVVLVFRDMTGRQQAEAQMREAQKLESLGLLAGGIAHDFNNLLTGILGNASLACETVPPDNPAYRMLEQVIAASQRAAELTRQMLAYAGRGRFVVLPVDLSELVRDIASLLRTSIPKRVDIRLELADDLPAVEADPSQMQQVIMNLVLNGAEAIAEDRNGWVVVKTTAVRLDRRDVARRFAAGTVAAGEFVCLEVEDNGCGMDEATRSRIFDPFFTTKFTGRGLGLSATAGIVRAQKGAIKVRSVPGGGSTFQVFFPAAAASRPQPAEVSPEWHGYIGSGTVLVVDDEEVVRRTAAAALERLGFSVLAAADGHEAVELFRLHSARVTLVLLDLTMPVLSGEQTLELLRQIRPGVKILLSSGYNEADATRRFRGKGLAGFLQKPYTAALLAEKLRAVLGAHSADTAA